ncbi:MAG: DNA primase [Luteococcus sp.]|uniref:DNA primase n=1 Tax=Luteococcus sp. TaxID=1969402 RepID=UPI002649373F|nr:DNA primase [Luteococcus sp.]MDN5562542.1 DNA primase [Luteococcus sp.]
MAGRINDEDIALVRERARIDDVVSSHVTLKPAGGGSLKGLCPFHDEKTPSFQVTPARGFYYCFGCGEGGDSITFLQKVSNLSFTESVQQLADRTGVQLRISDDGGPRHEPGLRVRIMEANSAASEFYSRQLLAPGALAARQMLDGRGFDRAAAEHFGVGYAPRGGRDLKNHLNRLGFKDAELVKAGLIREHGHDFFQGRVLWPIRDSGSAVLGFGARKLFDDDRMPAKYLNTPETPVYKKSHVLYGLDLARRQIGKKSQAVVVEGYTDVMAAHLSGVDTAVASCGTAFGDDHARMLQRLMGNQGAFSGEVIFTFDGDQAGQNAALKVFSGDQNFIAQTYVAIEPSGLDPCDLRLQQGEAAVRELVGRRVPLYRFVMENTLKGYDLDRVDGRLQALRAAAPLVSSIRDTSLVNGYLRELASMLGMDVDEVRSEVTRAARRKANEKSEPRHRTPVVDEPVEPQSQPAQGLPWPDPADRALGVERGTLKLMLQHPTLFDTAWDGVQPDDFTHPAYRAVFESILRVPWQSDRWADKVQEATTDEVARQLEIALLVEPVLRTPDEAYATSYAARVQLLRIDRDIKDLKSRLQRTNPVDQASEHKQMFSALLELEVRRKQLQLVSLGAPD